MAEIQISVKPMKFPSVNFPGADLRVNPNTKYEFICVACSAALAVAFGWVLSSSSALLSDIEPDLLAAINNYFSGQPSLRPIGGQSCITQCHSCGVAYIVYAEIEETSMGAYRVLVTGVAQVVQSKPEHAQ